MKTTTSGRAFAKGMFDIFSTLMVSLRIENRKIRWRSYPNSFTAEGAIGNLGNLQVTQSNRESDPNDPTRIITHVTTTQFSLSRDMSRNLCQTFMDARLLECATDSSKREFQSRGLYQVTPKGAYLLAKFVVRNKLPIGESRHITANSATNLVFLEREENEDAIILTEKQVDIIFKRFAGPEPNTARTDPGADSPMSSMSSTAEAKYRAPFVMDLSNGVEVKDQQFNSETYKDTFYGKAAVEWLLDYSTVISKEEAICICQEMVNARYIEQVGEENTNGPSIFKTGNSALYHLTETGRALAGWKSLDDCCGSIHNDWMDERSTAGSKAERSSPETNLLSTQFKLTSSNLARLPISIAQERRRSMDEVSLSTLQYNEDSNKSGPTRRLSQILNDPAFQITLSENGPMSSYAPSSSGRESVGASAGGAGSTRLSLPMSSAQSTTSNTSRLNGILSDAPVRDLFKSFLKQNFCEENLSFYFEVVDYKTKFKGLITSAKAYNISETGPEPNNMGFAYPPSLRELEKQICTQAFAIFETYLASGAPREVNLPHQMRQDITEYMQAVVRSMETSTVTTVTTPDGGNINNASLPPTPSSLPTSPSPADASDGGEKGGQKELIHISLFDLIHDHIFRLMSTDSVPKFIKTDKYLEVVMKKHKRKHAAAAAAAAAAVNSDDPLSLSLNQQDGLNGVNGKSANNGGGGGSSMANGDGVSEGNTTHAGSSRNEDVVSIRRSLSLSGNNHLQDQSLDSRDGLESNGGNTGAGAGTGGMPMESRSRSAGNGLLPARYPSTAVPSSQPGVSAIPTNLNLQQWRAPRTRSASSNVLTEGMRAQPPQYPHQSPSQYQNQYQYTGPPPASVYGGSSRLRSTSSNGSSNNSYSNNNNNSNNNISGSGANGQGAQSSRHGGGISSRGPPQTLMEIYAQQQQMQHQYSNQRAQLSQVQIQQMYGMRNSRSAPAFSKEQPSLDQHRQHRDTLQDQQHHQQQQQQQQQHQQHQQQQQMAKPPAGPLSPSSSDQVTVMFESTSFSVQDPNALVSAAVNDGDLSRRLSEEQGQ